MSVVHKERADALLETHVQVANENISKYTEEMFVPPSPPHYVQREERLPLYAGSEARTVRWPYVQPTEDSQRTRRNF